MRSNTIKNFMWDDQYIYCIDPNADEPILQLFDDIGNYEFCGISGSQVARELANLDLLGKTNINIIINSVGGSVTDGMSIYTTINRMKTPVTTYCGGFCLSIAAIIFLAGTNRIMADYGNLMIHNPYNRDNSIDEGLERARLSLIKMITKDKFDSQEIQELLNKETWMDAEEALKYGFATGIEKTIEKNKTIMLSKDKISAKHAFGNLIMNKFIESIKNKTTTEMGKLTKFNTVEELEAKLALKAVDADSRTRKDYEKEEGSDAGNDDTAVDEAEEMVDATTVCDKDEVIDEMGTTFESKEVNDETETSEMIDKKIVDALKEEIANLSNELKSIKEAKAKTEKEARDKKIIEALRSWTKQGKIKEDKETVALWTAELEKDFDNASKLINSFSVHKIAAKMYTNENKEAGKELSIQEKMKLIRDKKAGK